MRLWLPMIQMWYILMILLVKANICIVRWVVRTCDNNLNQLISDLFRHKRRLLLVFNHR